MRYFIKLSYNGAPFFGWQRQPKQCSVQECLETALSTLLKENVALTGCGRTDTGVHAREYYAHFDTEAQWNMEQIKDFVYRLNSLLPKEICVETIFPVTYNAHARFDALSRTYRYYLNLCKDPFSYPFAYSFYRPLDIPLMNEAAALLLQTDDFTSFSKVHTQVQNHICHVTFAQWKQEGNQLIFEITADRFLRNMVRAIVGTLLDVGLHKISVADFKEIIMQKNRNNAGTSVPAHALFLEKIRYPFI